MVNVTLPSKFSPDARRMISDNPERALAVSYAEPATRPALAALLALDDALGQLVRTTREPALGQIRLVWWRDRLEALDDAPPPAEPVLQGIFAELLPRGVRGASLVPMTSAWGPLLEDELDMAALRRFGEDRGATLFLAAGLALGAAAGDPVREAGQGWALADLSLHLSDVKAAEAARALARPLLDAALAKRWSRRARALGALAHLARLDLEVDRRPPGAPARVGRLLWHRLTGR